VISSVSRAITGADHAEWLRLLVSPEVVAVTVTVTEAGYLRGPCGGLDHDRPEVRADLAALSADPSATVRTAPALLLAGIAARRRADAGPLASVAARP
jgi:fructuronate reductase